MHAGRAHPHDVGEGTAAIDGEMPARGSAPGFIRSLARSYAGGNESPCRAPERCLSSMRSRGDAGTVDDQARAILDVVRSIPHGRVSTMAWSRIAPVCRAGLGWLDACRACPPTARSPGTVWWPLAVALPFPPARARIASSARGWRARACRRCAAASTWTATAGMVPPATSIGCCGGRAGGGEGAQHPESPELMIAGLLQRSGDRMTEAYVVFSHGKESGPWEARSRRCPSSHARRFQVESVDYQGSTIRRRG